MLVCLLPLTPKTQGKLWVNDEPVGQQGHARCTRAAGVPAANDLVTALLYLLALPRLRPACMKPLEMSYEGRRSARDDWGSALTCRCCCCSDLCCLTWSLPSSRQPTTQRSCVIMKMPNVPSYESPTPGIINAELLSWLPRGAAVVNAARGKHVDEQALLAALDEGTTRARATAACHVPARCIPAVLGGALRPGAVLKPRGQCECIRRAAAMFATTCDLERASRLSQPCQCRALPHDL